MTKLPEFHAPERAKKAFYKNPAPKITIKAAFPAPEIAKICQFKAPK